jgi:two-component system NtrC family response regulator
MKNATLPRILIVEDDESTRWLLGESLQRFHIRVEVFLTSSVTEGRLWLKESSADLVICDYHLGESTGLDVLKYLRDIKSEIPFLLYTSEELKNIPHVSYMNFKYIQKPELKELLDAVERNLKAS